MISKKVQEIMERMKKMPLPQWIVDIHEYRRIHGHYRPGDFYRLYGDPNEGVKMPMTTEELLAEIRRQREKRKQLPESWR